MSYCNDLKYLLYSFTIITYKRVFCGGTDDSFFFFYYIYNGFNEVKIQSFAMIIFIHSTMGYLIMKEGQRQQNRPPRKYLNIHNCSCNYK